VTSKPTFNAAGDKELPKISEVEFEKLFNQLKNWNEFSPNILERGSLNYITPVQVTKAASLVSKGEVVSMSLPWNTKPGLDNHKPALHYMTTLGDVDDQEPMCFTDFIGVDYHGKSITHFDAMTHMSFKNQMYGGKDAKVEVTSEGSSWASIDKLGPVITRGILIDAPHFFNKKWIEPGNAITADEILAIESKYNFKIGQGDCVLLRSGHLERQRELGVWDPSDFSAGFYLDAMKIFQERKISVLGADGDSDARPSTVVGMHSPIHTLALPALGIPLLDNLYLEELARKCQENNRWEFQVVIAPLHIPGGTGSPVTPLAVF
jgi:kynurenine formamidase